MPRSSRRGATSTPSRAAARIAASGARPTAAIAGRRITRNRGLPQEGIVGKIGIATTLAKPGRVWAIVEHDEEGAVYRSDDHGETWTKLSDNPDLRRRPWYYMHLVADPTDANTLWNLNVQFLEVD